MPLQLLFSVRWPFWKPFQWASFYFTWLLFLTERCAFFLSTFGPCNGILLSVAREFFSTVGHFTVTFPSRVTLCKFEGWYSSSVRPVTFYNKTFIYTILQACTLKRIQKHPPEGDTFSTSDSTTYYDEDDMSCSDESSPDVGQYVVLLERSYFHNVILIEYVSGADVSQFSRWRQRTVTWAMVWRDNFCPWLWKFIK